MINDDMVPYELELPWKSDEKAFRNYSQSKRNHPEPVNVMIA